MLTEAWAGSCRRPCRLGRHVNELTLTGILAWALMVGRPRGRRSRPDGQALGRLRSTGMRWPRVLRLVIRASRVCRHPPRTARAVAVARLDGWIEVRNLGGKRGSADLAWPSRRGSGPSVSSPVNFNLVSGEDDGGLTFWDIAGVEQPVRMPAAHPRAVLDLAFDRDGRLMATACDDGSIRIWDAQAAGPLIHTLAGHGDRSRDGVGRLRLCRWRAPPLFRAAATGSSTCLELPATGRALWFCSNGTSTRSSPCRSAATAGRLVSLGSDRDLAVWSLDRREPSIILNDVDILTDLAWHQAASVLAAVCEDGSLILEMLPRTKEDLED